MRLRLAVFLSCAVAAPLAQVGGTTPSDTQETGLSFAAVWMAFPFSRILIIAFIYGALFKLFARWPKHERWLVGASLIALPLFATYVLGWFVRFGSQSPVRDTGIFWTAITLGAAITWWLIKYKTDLLKSWTPAAEVTQVRASAPPRKEAATIPPANPPVPAAASPAPAPPPSRRPPFQEATPQQSGEARPTSKPAAVSRDAIFISYRRQDSADVTGRIYDRLVQRFGREQIFKDVDSIPLGVDFREHLGAVVGKCNLLLAVIGPQWLTSAGPNGRRLEEQSDYVRIEIESALTRKIPVIPLLVGSAALPSESELPPSLGPITYRNGIAVRPDPDFHHDMDRLIAGLEQHGHS